MLVEHKFIAEWRGSQTVNLVYEGASLAYATHAERFDHSIMMCRRCVRFAVTDSGRLFCGDAHYVAAEDLHRVHHIVGEHAVLVIGRATLNDEGVWEVVAFGLGPIQNPTSLLYMLATWDDFTDAASWTFVDPIHSVDRVIGRDEDAEKDDGA